MDEPVMTAEELRQSCSLGRRLPLSAMAPLIRSVGKLVVEAMAEMPQAPWLTEAGRSACRIAHEVMNATYCSGEDGEHGGCPFWGELLPMIREDGSGPEGEAPREPGT